MAGLAQEIGCHFHVDAAWGGPTLFSEKYRGLLRGIERADSVTIDAHKQLYVPMGAGMVLFKDPATLAAIEHHAAYIIRHGSKDLGSHTLEGSRPGKAMLVHAGLSIIGRKGYELLIDQGIERARRFAEMITEHPDFELVTSPELNILTYRYNPASVQEALRRADIETTREINELLDKVTKRIQKRQREAGKTFVSRTRLAPARYHDETITVFRAVLANPLTTEDILISVLEEQCEWARHPEIFPLLDQLQKVTAPA
jgi:glutamate decarboxylase